MACGSCKASEESRSKDSLPVQTTVSDSDLLCCLVVAGDGSCLLVVVTVVVVVRSGWLVSSLGGVSVIFESFIQN